MKYLKRYWLWLVVGITIVYFLKPGWLSFMNGGNPVGGPSQPTGKSLQPVIGV